MNVHLRFLLLLSAASVLPAQSPARSVADLRAFFQQNCVKCHGADGSAHAADGKKLRGFDFTDAKALSEQTDAKMIHTIRKGIFFGWIMPSFKDQLSEADAAGMVREVLRKAQKGKPIAR
ncbi:MAG TPA: cytochrome c [Holophagaceae bacterium]